MIVLKSLLFLLINLTFIICETEISSNKLPIEVYENGLPKNSNSYCLSSLTQADCGEDEIIMPNWTEFGCPACVSDGENINEMCNEEQKCKYGLKCNDANCDIDRSTCSYTYHLKHLDEDIAHIDPNKLPTCEIDGTFGAVQCKGDRITGRCFCYSPEGTRIYGWAWWHELNNKEMNCACSRLKYKMEKDGLHGNTIHCDKMGNFEELQCNDGLCWCANILTGEMQNKTRAVPENMWTFLPCYDLKYHGEQYLRQCESIAFAQHVLNKAMKNHGTTNAEFNYIMCDYDGSYGPIKNLDGKIYCQWTDGKNIGSFAANANEIKNMKCFCARDQKIFQLAGLGHRLTCNGLGNYEPNQNINGKSFCVDYDGFAVNEAYETTELIDCKKYTYYLVQIKEKEYTSYDGNYEYSSDEYYDHNENYY